MPQGIFAEWYTLAFAPMAAKDGTLYSVYYTFNQISHSPDRPTIRKYDTCSDTWDILAGATRANGPEGNINVMVVSGDYLFVGGYFETIGGIFATNIAKYQFSTGIWSPVGDGTLTNKPIVAITLPVENPNNVYVALQVGLEEDGNAPIDAEMVKRWNGSQWETVGQGLLAHWNGVGDSYSVSVSAMTTDGTNIYVAGYFNGAISADGSSMGSRNLIKWNPGTGKWEQEAITCEIGQDDGNGHVIVLCSSETAPANNVYAMATKQDPNLGTFIFEAGGFQDDPFRCCDHNPGRGIFMQLDGTYGNSGTFLGQNCQQGGIGSGFGLAKYGGNLYLSGEFDSFGCATSAGSVGQMAAGNNYWEPIGSPSAMTYNSQPAYFDQITADQYAIYVRGVVDNVEGAPCFSSLARYPLQPFPSGPCQGKIGWWQMEGNAIDTAMGHNGSVVNSFKFGTGKYGSGIVTSGNPGGLSVADDSALNFGSSASGTDFTLEAWVKPENATTSYGVLNIIDKRVVSGSVTGYELALSDGKLIFQMASGGIILSAGPYGNDLRSDGNWHHVAVTVQRNSSTGGKLYVDGVQVGSSFNPTSISGDLTTTAPLLIGLHPDPALDCNFRGSMDEPGIYRRALTASEISGIYTSGKQYPGSLPADAVAWWPLEGDGSDIVGGHYGVVKQTFEFQVNQSPQYIQLYGKAGGFNVPDASDLNFGTAGDFTIEAWVKPDTAVTDYGVMDIVDKRVTSGTVVGYELALCGGQLVFQMASGGLILSAGPVGSDLRTGGNWHHVAVTVQRNSSTGGRLYVDGSQVGSSFNPTTISGSITSAAPLLIGMHPDAGLNCNFRGGIDEVVMYNRPLSATEIQSAFVAGHP